MKKITIVMTVMVLALSLIVIPQTAGAKSKIPTTKPSFSNWDVPNKTKTPTISYKASWKKVKSYEYRYCFKQKEEGFVGSIRSRGYTYKTSISGDYKANSGVLKKAKKKGTLTVTIKCVVIVCTADGRQGDAKTISKTVTWKYNKKNGKWYKK